jgi:hypothetical protein
MAKKKKKKRSSAELHRNVKDSLLALPFVVDEQKKKGKTVKAFMLRYVTAPVLRLMNKALDASRYRGQEGDKTRQTEQMRRHLEHRKAAIKHVQGQMQQQKRKRPL